MLKVYYLITFLIYYLVPLVLKFRLLKKKEDPDRYKEKLGKYIKNNIYGEYLINAQGEDVVAGTRTPCLLYTSPSPRDLSTSRMPSSA